MTVLKQTPRNTDRETDREPHPEPRPETAPYFAETGRDRTKPAAPAKPAVPTQAKPGLAAPADRLDITRLSAREIASELARNSRSDRPAMAAATPASTSWQSLAQPAPAQPHGNPTLLSPAERQRIKSAYVEDRYRREDEEQARLRAEELRQSLRQGYHSSPRDGGPHDRGQAGKAASALAQGDTAHRYAAQRSFAPPPSAPHERTGYAGDAQPAHVDREAAQIRFAYDDPACPQPDYPAEAFHAVGFGDATATPVTPDMPPAPPVTSSTVTSSTVTSSILSPETMPTTRDQPHVLSAFDLPPIDQADQPEVLLLDDTRPPLYRQLRQDQAVPPASAEEREAAVDPDSPYPGPIPPSLASPSLVPPLLAPSTREATSIARAGLRADPSIDRYSAGRASVDPQPRTNKTHAAQSYNTASYNTAAHATRAHSTRDRLQREALDIDARRNTGWRNALAATTLLAVLAVGPALYLYAHLGGGWQVSQSSLRADLDQLLQTTGIIGQDQATAAKPAVPAGQQMTAPVAAPVAAPPAAAAAVASPAPAAPMQPLSAGAAPAPAATGPAPANPPAVTQPAPAVAAAATPVTMPKMARRAHPHGAVPDTATTGTASATATPVQPVKAATSDTRNAQPDDAIGDLITAAGATTPAATSHLTTNPGTLRTPTISKAARKTVQPVTGSAWMKAQPYDPDKVAAAPRETSEDVVHDGDGEAVIYDGTPDAWLKRQPYNPGVLTAPAN